MVDVSKKAFARTAFSNKYGVLLSRDQFGMTLREWYAVQAMQGMLAHSTRYRPRNSIQNWHTAIAEEAFEIADAMIALTEASQ